MAESLDALLALQGDHSIFAPSASHRWLACSGSLVAGLLCEDTAGYDAAWGTVGHDIAAEWLESGEEPTHRLGETVLIDEGHEVFEILVSRTMLRHVGRYVAWAQALDGDHYVEKRVHFDAVTPITGQSGTADFVALQPGLLQIRDLKLGIHVQVFAGENPQLMLYALGAYYRWNAEYAFETVSMGIGQPRLDHWDVWEIDVSRLLAFAEHVRERAHRAWALNAPRTPGPTQCQFCPAKKDCPAFLKVIEDLTSRSYDTMGSEMGSREMGEIVESDVVDVGRLPNPRKLTVKQRSDILFYRGAVESFFKACAESLASEAQAGVEIPRRKLVHSRTRRAFRSPLDAVEELRFYGLDDGTIFDTKIRSPNQLHEELMNAGYSSDSIEDLYRDIVYQPQGRPTLVAETDKRPSISQVADDIFGDLDEDDDVFADLNDDDEL